MAERKGGKALPRLKTEENTLKVISESFRCAWGRRVRCLAVAGGENEWCWWGSFREDDGCFSRRLGKAARWWC